MNLFCFFPWGGRGREGVPPLPPPPLPSLRPDAFILLASLFLIYETEAIECSWMSCCASECYCALNIHRYISSRVYSSLCCDRLSTFFGDFFVFFCLIPSSFIAAGGLP
ncbi:unnamed protein product [Sphacelaria rigidula]